MIDKSRDSPVFQKNGKGAGVRPLRLFLLLRPNQERGWGDEKEEGRTKIPIP